MAMPIPPTASYPSNRQRNNRRHALPSVPRESVHDPCCAVNCVVLAGLFLTFFLTLLPVRVLREDLPREIMLSLAPGVLLHVAGYRRLLHTVNLRPAVAP